jgi:NADPH:quinone reductase-like Zn-dependent oxidoreductase
VSCSPQRFRFAAFAPDPGSGLYATSRNAQEGASIPVNYLTAWQLMVVMGGLKPNETALIHSAGGGVGIATTQIAKHIGAKVIGTASAAKHGELRALGVDHLIDYRTEDFEARARQITGGRGVELILDAIGGDSLKKDYRLLASTGRSGCLGFRRRPRTRREGCSACCPCSRARPGFSSIRCP